MINHIHYITDLLMPKDVDMKKLQPAGTTESDGLDSMSIPEEGKKAVAFSPNIIP